MAHPFFGHTVRSSCEQRSEPQQDLIVEGWPDEKLRQRMVADPSQWHSFPPRKLTEVQYLYIVYINISDNGFIITAKDCLPLSNTQLCCGHNEAANSYDRLFLLRSTREATYAGCWKIQDFYWIGTWYVSRRWCCCGWMKIFVDQYRSLLIFINFPFVFRWVWQ